MTTQTGWGGGRLRRFGCSHFLSILEVPRLYIAAALDAFYFLVSQLILKTSNAALAISSMSAEGVGTARNSFREFRAAKS
jgi:hypothetical protein